MPLEPWVENVETAKNPSSTDSATDHRERSAPDSRMAAAPVTKVRRVAILGSRGIPARHGGFETFAEELAMRLVRERFRVTVFCERTHAPGSERHGDVHLVHVRAFPVGPLRTILFDVLCMIRALRGYDVIYMLGYGAAWAFWLPRLFRVRLIVNMDGVEWKRAKWSRVARWYLRVMEGLAVRLADRVVADAHAVRLHLERRHGPLRHGLTIPYGANLVESTPDPGLLSPFGLRPDTYYLVVCRVEPENHVLEIVSAFLASGIPRDLVLVGPLNGTAYSESVRKAAGSRVHLAGPVYDRETLHVLRFHARAYIHGHSVGGTNPSLLEALACGNVVIAHDNPFNREVLGNAGLYFRDATELEERLQSTEASANGGTQPLRRTMQDIVRRRYTWDRILVEYTTLFTQLDE